MRRRDFITLFGGAALIAARSQQEERTRRIGWLGGSLVANDPESQARKAAFLQGLRELGWTEGQNVRIDYRWGAGSADIIRKHAAELIALTPDVTLAIATANMLLQESRTIPIVFTQVPDPIGAGFADLPVQAPTKYETAVNVKTAKALGLTVPPGLFVAADRVIE